MVSVAIPGFLASVDDGPDVEIKANYVRRDLLGAGPHPID
jgi:hypothetical protein